MELASSAKGQAKQGEFHEALARAAKLSTLAEPGAPPFHLKLIAQETRTQNAEYNTEIEIWWAGPDRWKRTVKSATFNQVAIQNGAQYYESNSVEDYLPHWVDELIRGATNPVPIEEFANVEADEDRPGCRNWEMYHGSGAEKFSTYASVCFNRDGTANQIFASPIGLQLANYQRFGNKQIARQLAVWPGDRSEVAGSITTLEGLEASADGAEGSNSKLFEVPKDTGLSARVRFIQGEESQLMAADSPARAPLSWPTSYTFPVDGLIAITVEIDRQGNVRGFPSAISKNQGINGGAVEQIKNWKFKPYVVDGAPVQVLATLLIPYHMKYEPLGANGKEFPPISFNEHIARYRGLCDLRAEGRKAFHMHATFTLNGGQAGNYDEIWNSPNEWKHEVEAAGVVLRATKNKGQTEPVIHGDRNRTDLKAVLNAMQDRLPDPRILHEADWGNSAVPAGNVYPNGSADGSEPALIRTAVGAVDANNHPTSGQAYWFDSEGLLRANFADGSTIVNSNFELWDGLRVARRIELFSGTTPTAVITVDSIVAQ
jgi:hypothetical protein